MKALAPEEVGDVVDPTSVHPGQILAYFPSLAGHAFPYRVDYLFGEAANHTKDTRCTATNLTTGKRAVLRLGQLRQRETM